MPNGRCYRHGGASTGPRTAEGLARSKRANWRHGRRSADYIATRRAIAQAGRDLTQMLKALQADDADLDEVRAAWGRANASSSA